MNRDYALKIFAYEHLKEGPLRDTSARFHALMLDLFDDVPENAERTIALRLLLQAKDAAVRAVVIGAQPK